MPEEVGWTSGQEGWRGCLLEQASHSDASNRRGAVKRLLRERRVGGGKEDLEKESKDPKDRGPQRRRRRGRIRCAEAAKREIGSLGRPWYDDSLKRDLQRPGRGDG